MATKSNSVKPVPSTRSVTEMWLIGQVQTELPGNVLPTTGDVLKYFFYYHHVLKKSVPESAKCASHILINIWNRARILTSHQPYVIAKLKEVVDEYNLIKKNRGRNSVTQHSREQHFIEKQKQLFDIACNNAESLIKIDEDKTFLEDQRTSRRMHMSGEDKKLSQKEARAVQRRQIEEEQKKREEERKRENVLSVLRNQHSDDSDNEDQEEDVGDDDDYEVEIPLYHKKQLMEANERPQSSESTKPTFLQEVLSSPDVSSVIDRVNLSDRKFTLIAAAIAKASGQDLDSSALSRSTVRRKRTQHRLTIDSCIREEFQSLQKPPLLVHWDGKLMKDSTNVEDLRSNVDRLAVIVTGHNVDKILGIVKIPSGTGQAQAKATFQLLSLWNVANDIVGMCFDTTAANTGSMSGACVLLEKLAQRNFLYFACRHHMHEIIIGEVFSTLFGPSRGPNIALFERFSKFWPSIEQMNYKPLDDTRLDSPMLQQLKEEVGLFLTQFLSAENSYVPREDYREMIELCLLLLGCPLPTDKQYHFHVPGAYHMARWMAKVIYCMKIYLFRDEFKLTVSEIKSLTEFCLFVTHVYVKAWITCPVASDAPLNDLQLLKRIRQYEEINTTVSQAAMKKLKNHLWYLGSEMVALSLFSSKISNEEKRLITETMVHCGGDWTVRGIRYPAAKCGELESKQLHELITSSSTAAMSSLGLDVGILAANVPETWNDIPSFQHTATVVNSIKVVNDVAERSVALMSSFNQSITKKEAEMQKLIQVVEDNRQRIPDFSKSTLKAYKLR